MSVSIEVPAGGPLFDGHFPGRPILPGVAGLSMVVLALAPNGGPLAVRSIPFLRFRALVAPGDALDVAASKRGPDGATRFEVRRSGTRVVEGSIIYGPPEDAEDPGPWVAARAARGLAPLDELIPHRPPMRLVETVLGEADEGATCRGRVSRACALVSGGTAPALVALEAAAQTAAVWEALRRSRAEGAPSARIGYLVSAHDVTIHRATIPADTDLYASVRLSGLAGPLSQYAIEVVTEGTVALRGTIGTYLSP